MQQFVVTYIAIECTIVCFCKTSLKSNWCKSTFQQSGSKLRPLGRWALQFGLVGRLCLALWPYFYKDWKWGSKFYISPKIMKICPNFQKGSLNSTILQKQGAKCYSSLKKRGGAGGSRGAYLLTSYYDLWGAPPPTLKPYTFSTADAHHQSQT